MADNIFFSRDTRVFLVQGANIWEIPVLNGYTATQSTNTSEITLAEMADAAGNSRRGRQAFTDSQAPAEWSLDTYLRPTTIAGPIQTAVEEPLWANFVAANAFSAGAWTANNGAGTPVPAVARTATGLDINFLSSNKTTIGTFDMYIVFNASASADLSFSAAEGSMIYRLAEASINELGITFDIDGIATGSWSGNASTMREVATFNATGAIRTGIDASNNFIRNRLTQLTAVRRNIATGAVEKTYDITLTGGSITITNNLSYLTPELIGRVNTPLGHITGTRAVGGSFTCYLDTKTNGTADLYEDLSTDTVAIRNRFDLDFFIGGASGTANTPRAPGVVFSIPRAHITIPTHDTGDVIALSCDFTALPSDMGTADEIDLVRYVGPGL